MKKTIQILFFVSFLIFGSGFISYAQTIRVACSESVVRYGVYGNNGTSDFYWTIEGGTIVETHARGDSVDILWNNVAGARVISIIERNNNRSYLSYT
ncbi:MAG: hypothetical protein PF485_15105 [Bacteroidales bacterium]|nr:hypothetical protein [Bacteroidales bacterium]